MTKYVALIITAAATLMAGACAKESTQSLTGPTSITSSTAATNGVQMKRYALSGTVDSIVKPLTPLRNARVQIRSGVDNGRFAVTDANGDFVLNGINADTLSVTVSLDGYATWATTVQLYSDVQIAPKLEPLQ